jgi:tetratricopeptide (TPR) repeat protein
VKHYITTLLSFLLFGSLLSQEDSSLDSLYNLLHKPGEDTSVAMIYAEMANNYAFTNPDSAVYYGEKALDLSQKLGYSRGILRSWWALGVNSVYQNDLVKSKEQFIKALDAAEKVPSPWDQAVALRILGNITFTLGEYPEALDFHSSCLDVSLEYNYTDIIPECYHNIGYVYYETGEYDRAFEYLELCHQATKEYEIIDLYPNSLNNMAKVATYKKDFEQARIYARGILGMVDSLPNASNFVPVAYEHIGESFYLEHEYDSSLFYFYKMLHSLEELDEMYMGPKMIEEILAYRGIGKSQMGLKQYKEAESSLLKAFKLSDEADNLEDKSEVARALSEVYEKSGDMTKSLSYFKVYKTTSDSILSDEKIREITQVRMENEFAERQKYQELLQAQKDAAQKRKEYIYIIVLITVMLILATVFLLYTLQRTKTEKTELRRKNLQQNIDFKNQELASNVLYLMKKNELLMKISRGLKKAKLGTKSTTNEAIDDIVREIEISSKDMGWEEFEMRLKEVHADFFNNLSKKYPDLSPNEQRLAAFLKLNMSTKDISAITFQSANSIRMARSRMRKKMGINESDNLVAVLNQL